MSSVKNLSIEARLRIKADGRPMKHVVMSGIDFDLLQIQINRFVETFGGDAKLELDSLKIDSATVRSSLYVKTLTELQGFINNLETYCKQQQPNDPLQSISEYVGCYDARYPNIRADQVLDYLAETIVTCYPRSHKPRGLKEYGYEVAQNWLVVINQAI